MAVKKLITKSYLKKENWSSKKMTIYNSFKTLRAKTLLSQIFAVSSTSPLDAASLNTC